MPFPLPPSDSGSATSACPERNQRRALSVSSVVNSPPAPISAPTSAHSASSAISALNPLPAFSFLSLNSKFSALNCPSSPNSNYSRTGHPTLDVHPELAEGIFSDSSYPLPQSTESSRKYPNHSSKSNYSRTYKTPRGGGIYRSPGQTTDSGESGTQHEPPSHLRVAPPGI